LPLLFFCLIPPPPRSTLFPYTTLFRSCRGCQLINVALGGTLIEHLPEGEGGVRHRASESESARHPVAAWGRLAGILGCGEIEPRSEEHTSELQSRENLVCRLLLEKKKK